MLGVAALSLAFGGGLGSRLSPAPTDMAAVGGSAVAVHAKFVHDNGDYGGSAGALERHRRAGRKRRVALCRAAAAAGNTSTSVPCLPGYDNTFLQLLASAGVDVLPALPRVVRGHLDPVAGV